jgi:hypothetical protein
MRRAADSPVFVNEPALQALRLYAEHPGGVVNRD